MLVWIVRSRTSYKWQMASCCIIVAASSRSELVINPVGLLVETNLAWIMAGKGNRHRTGACWDSAGGRITPPIPRPLALVVPYKTGCCATSSCRRVGLVWSDCANQVKSAKVYMTRDSDAVAGHVVCLERRLHVAEKPLCPRDGNCHGPELA